MPGRILSDTERDDLDFTSIRDAATSSLTGPYNEQQADLDELQTQVENYEQRGAREHFRTAPMNYSTRILFEDAAYAAHEFTASRDALEHASTPQAAERYNEATTAWIRTGTAFSEAVHDVLEARDQDAIATVGLRTMLQQEAETLLAQQQQPQNGTETLNGDIAQALNGNGAQPPNGNGARADTARNRPHNHQNGTGQQRGRRR
ncbi:hypothetical protein [Streptomyces fumanus]|uniref:hypothetical protein n=1 Tax=Streptomyces fumanus TaxID=67302 RepID=UPI0033D5C70E